MVLPVQFVTRTPTDVVRDAMGWKKPEDGYKLRLLNIKNGHNHVFLRTDEVPPGLTKELSRISVILAAGFTNVLRPQDPAYLLQKWEAFLDAIGEAQPSESLSGAMIRADDKGWHFSVWRKFTPLPFLTQDSLRTDSENEVLDRFLSAIKVLFLDKVFEFIRRYDPAQYHRQLL